jgi:hypothetical protein
MTQKELFEKLGAPLKNSRWSWGAIRPDDGVVFLRVWQDEVHRIAEKENIYVRVTDQPSGDDGPGYKERLEHSMLVANGAPCYLVMCRAVDTSTVPRSMRDFNKQEVFLGGDNFEDENGCLWIELKKRLPLREALP